MNPDAKLSVYDTHSKERAGSAHASGLDVSFPDGVRGWPDVLDCRVEPYRSRSIDENCAFATHVHKPFILIDESALESAD